MRPSPKRKKGVLRKSSCPKPPTPGGLVAYVAHRSSSWDVRNRQRFCQTGRFTLMTLFVHGPGWWSAWCELICQWRWCFFFLLWDLKLCISRWCSAVSSTLSPFSSRDEE